MLFILFLIGFRNEPEFYEVVGFVVIIIHLIFRLSFKGM